MTALYRKYRPRTFDEVVGQEPVVRTLRNAIEHDSVRQAYLFAGPRGTGKTSMARILAKSLNAPGGPTADPDPDSPIAQAIANGTSLDVVEMDAASQRGIDDVREIRERAVLQPVEGRYKVYIVDEAHQLTDAAWNALLKLIEEPPPHLLFVFATTDLAKVLPTVRSRCQTFVFQRPKLPELVRYLRRIADGEAFEAPDAALSLVARSARGSYRDAVSTLDQLAAATEGKVTVQAVLQLLGAVEEEALFRLCDLVVDRDTAGALTLIEELSEQGQDLGRLVVDLLEHLRHLLLVQHLGAVPETLPVTEETRERLRDQANQLGEATVVRLIDLLAVAVDDLRQGGDPRLPLELALVKVTRPAADLSRESMAYRLEQLEAAKAPVRDGGPVEAVRGNREAAQPPVRDSGPVEGARGNREVPPAEQAAAPPTIELEQLQEAWQRTILPAVEGKPGGIPAASMLREAHPTGLEGDTLTLEFPPSAGFHRRMAEDPKNAGLLRDALYEVTGRRLALAFAEGENGHDEDEERPTSEEDLLALVRDTFDATDVDDEEGR